jgi:hypothetical protein
MIIRRRFFAAVGALAVYVPLSLVVFGWHAEDAALASYPEKRCDGHDLCNIRCRMLLTFECTRGKPGNPVCKEVQACKDCVCEEIYDDPYLPPIDCHCKEPRSGW